MIVSTQKQKEATITKKTTKPHTRKPSTKKPAPAPALSMPAPVDAPRARVTAQPEPIVPVARVTMTRGAGRSKATEFGTKAVRYLRIHAKHPYGKKGEQGIVDIVRAAWRAALVEVESAAVNG